MRATIAEPRPPLDAHNALATTLADELGVAPSLVTRPERTEALLFGPLLPPRYRLDGTGALPDAAEQFSTQLADIEALRGYGLGEAADIVSRPTALS